MAYALDEKDLGIFTIAMLGIGGLAVFAYSSSKGSPSMPEISSFVLAVGGLVIALLRGRSDSTNTAPATDVAVIEAMIQAALLAQGQAGK